MKLYYGIWDRNSRLLNITVIEKNDINLLIIFKNKQKGSKASDLVRDEMWWLNADCKKCSLATCLYLTSM